MSHHTLQMSLHYLVKHKCQKIAITGNTYSDNNKSQGSVGVVVLLYYRIIVLFAGERIFKIGTLLAKLEAKWFDCFTCPVCSALSW